MNVDLVPQTILAGNVLPYILVLGAEFVVIAPVMDST
jgi:hypothetical protein